MDSIVDKLDIELLVKKYAGGGTSSYHPGMLLKVMVYSCVKYNYFDKEQKGKKKDDPFAIESLYYDAKHDRFYCAMGQPMERINDRKRITASGFIQQNKRYQAMRCEGCPLRGMCFKEKYNRVIEVNSNLNRLKVKARERLTEYPNP